MEGGSLLSGNENTSADTCCSADESVSRIRWRKGGGGGYYLFVCLFGV